MDIYKILPIYDNKNRRIICISSRRHFVRVLIEFSFLFLYFIMYLFFNLHLFQSELRYLTAQLEGQTPGERVRREGPRPEGKVMEPLLPRLGPGLPGSVNRDLDGLVVGGDLGRRRRHNDREREALPCKNRQ